jgi:peptidylprolyl isomerase
MNVGDTKTIEIAADDAYGPYREEHTLQVRRDQFPPGDAPEVGQPLQLGMEGGDVLEVVVADVGDEFVTLDANHPLAGEDLIFDLELVGID